MIARGLAAVLPDRDPRQTALEELYDVKFGNDTKWFNEGYNPVSGNPLTQHMDYKRPIKIELIKLENTLKTKYNDRC